MRSDPFDSTPGGTRRVLPAGIYAILDLGLCAARRLDPARTARALCRAGAAVVQLRAKHLPDGALIAIAREVRAECRGRRVPFVVNDRADVAVIVGADGVHVGQRDLPPSAIRRLAPRLLVGLSTHGAAQLRGASRTAADYVGLGPLFPTATKLGPDPTLGLRRFRALVGCARLPVVAIGGIRIADVPAVRAAGAHAVAMAAALLGDGDPARNAAAAVAAFRRSTVRRI